MLYLCPVAHVPCRFLQLKGKKTVAPSAPDKSIIALDRKGRKNEIFVDILERLTVLFNSNVSFVCSNSVLFFRYAGHFCRDIWLITPSKEAFR